MEDERDTGTISRAEIFEKLSLTKDLQRLRKDIELDGQINEAVWVALDKNTQNYVVYEGNKDSFIDNNINMPRTDRDYFVDLSLVEDLETNFVITEVKRHIFCSC